MFREPIFIQKDRPLEERIYDYIDAFNSVTFAELHRFFGEEFEGDMDVGFLDKNILWWRGVNQQFADALHTLLKEKKIVPIETSYLTYLVDGEMLCLPIAKRLRHFCKKPRWLPVVLSVTRG